MMEILPAILAHDEQDFHEHLFHPGLRRAANLFHIDILDNTLVHGLAWSDPRVISSWRNLPEFELHCMTQNALSHIDTWQSHISSVRRVIVHAETGRQLTRDLPALAQQPLETVIAVNPATPIDSIASHVDTISAVQIMGVEPGKSGQSFLGDPILSKIRRCQALFPNLRICIDGGVSLANIGQLKNVGVHRCVASSAVWKAENPEEALLELRNRVR